MFVIKKSLLNAMSSKILICTFTFPPNKDGVAVASALMAFGLAERGHDVIVATGHLDARTDLNPHPRVQVTPFMMDYQWPPRGECASEARRMHEFILKEAPDVIISHCWDIWPTLIAENTFPLISSKKILISHGFTSHLWSPRWRPPFGLGAWLRNLLKMTSFYKRIRSYDRVVFLSAKQDWNRFLDHRVAVLSGYNGIRIIPNGTVAVPMRSSITEFRNKHIGNSGLVFCYVANFFRAKNQALAIRAFRKARLEGATLILIGSEFNSYTDELRHLNQDLAEAYPDGTVVFVEKLERPVTMAAYAACDVFLLTSKTEAQPIVLLEAMAAGKPFVSTDVGCVRDLPGGIVARSERGLVSALQRLAKDVALRDKLGEEGKRAVMSIYNQEAVTDAHARLVDEVLASEPAM